MLGGVLACGLTHAGITPLDVAKCNMQVGTIHCPWKYTPRFLSLGKPCQVHRQYQCPKDHRCGRRHKGRLERFRPHSGRILPPGHVQVWPLRDIQRLLHESRWPRSVREVQGGHLARWLRKRRILRRYCALPVRDDQGQGSDKPCWHLPRPLRCRLGRNEPHQSRYPLPLRLYRPSVVSSGAVPSPAHGRPY